ncbi:MAG: hypothetical protein AB8F74_12740 [Saprospiraceae bacterium]
MENFILNSKFFDQSVIKLPKEQIDPTLLSGSNQKNILIVCIKQREEEKTDIDFLEKIFASVKVNLTSDATLLLLEKEQHFSWKAINEATDFKQLIYFGDSLKNLGLQISGTVYTPFEYQDKTILFAEFLDLIAADRGKKGALWKGLKEVFE